MKFIVALAWLREEDWPAWQAMDPSFKPDYGTWLANMSALYEHQTGLGLSVSKVPVDIGEFLDWQKTSGFGVNSKGRAEFASFKIARDKFSH